MNLFGIDFDIQNKPVLDESFIPLSKFNQAFLQTAKKPLCVAVERDQGLIAVFETFIHGTTDRFDADCYYVERLVKMLLWTKGGYRIMICGDEKVAQYITTAYSSGGKRAFDADFMSVVYENKFEVGSLPYEERPSERDQPKSLGRHLDGCRIGFDAGG
ncbi:MAG TPA: ROK family protein, partial [Clostridia bacterium]|nr:ROK family protein [Clostridia bacterium]